jgi:hypothetical protein
MNECSDYLTVSAALPFPGKQTVRHEDISFILESDMGYVGENGTLKSMESGTGLRGHDSNGRVLA